MKKGKADGRMRLVVISAIVFFVLGMVVGTVISFSYVEKMFEEPSLMPWDIKNGARTGPSEGDLVEPSSPVHTGGYVLCRIYWGVFIVGLINPEAADWACAGANS